MKLFKLFDTWLVCFIAQPIHHLLEKISYGKTGFWFARAYLNLFFVIFVGYYFHFIYLAVLEHSLVTIFHVIQYCIVAWMLYEAFIFYEMTSTAFQEDATFDIDEHRFIRTISALFLVYTFYKDRTDAVEPLQWNQIVAYTLGILAMLSGFAIACRPSSYFDAKTRSE